MPDDTEGAGGDSPAPQEPKVRRISIKTPRKKAKAPRPETEPEMEVASEEFDPTPPPDAGKTLTEPSGDAAKRKNRRRKGKAKTKAAESEEILAESKAQETPEQVDRQPQRSEHPPQPQKPRHKPDPEKVAKNAWKIFLAEVSEEGVALIGDNDARELARRCFRLSEIFLEEEARRR
jgi:hypothetical protein